MDVIGIAVLNRANSAAEADISGVIDRTNTRYCSGVEELHIIRTARRSPRSPRRGVGPIRADGPIVSSIGNAWANPDVGVGESRAEGTQ